MTGKTDGNYFENFAVGQRLRHAVPLTLSEGDASLYRALHGGRHALYSAAPLARAAGFQQLPVDPLLAFHVVFGKSVPDISLNAFANLGYAEGRFLRAVHPGDTLAAESEVIGVKETSSGKNGIVYVRTTGTDQSGAPALSFVRWVLVNKRDASSPAPEPVVPGLASTVPASELRTDGHYRNWDAELGGSPRLWGDYAPGERIDHVDGVTVEEAEHQMATRLYHNTAKVHFNQLAQAGSRFGRRLIYGGVVISLARALSFNGLANAAEMLAINAGTHAAPLFAGDTVFAWSEVLETAELGPHAGALRLRLVAVKNRDASAFPLRGGDGKYEEGVILDFDYWAAMPR